MNRATLSVNLISTLALAIFAQHATVVATASGLRTVALTGHPAPGTTGNVTYDNFGSYYDSLAGQFFRGPVLNEAGQVAFRADLTGTGVTSNSNQGIWSEGSGSLSLVARTGSHAPGAPGGVNFRVDPTLELYTPVLNRAGQTAFYGGLTDGSVGLWSEGTGGLNLVARSGVQAPDAPDGAILSFSTALNPYHLDWPKLNDAGQTAFVGALTGAGVTSANNWGVWSNGPGGLELVARAGDHAPGAPFGVNYGVSTFAPFPSFLGALNGAGHVALWANLTGTGIVGNQSYGIWSGAPNSLALVTRSGSPAPAPPGVTIDLPLGVTALNNAGQVAFAAALSGSGVTSTTNEGLWSTASGSLALMARKGSQAAGAPSGVNYLAFGPSYPVLNDGGRIAFRALVAGSGVDSSNQLGIWSDGLGELSLLARTGSPAAGTAENANFFDLHFPTLNSAGQTAFRANLSGDGVDFTNDRGIWATDQTGDLKLVVRTGDQLEVAPGDFRTLSDLDFATASGNADSRPSGFNNVGQLVFWASFTDGSEGVFVSNVVAHLPGDFNNDGAVDAADYAVWRKSGGSPAGYDLWRAHFGLSFDVGLNSSLISGQSQSAAIPEPTNIALLVVGVCALIVPNLRNRSTD